MKKSKSHQKAKNKYGIEVSGKLKKLIKKNQNNPKFVLVDSVKFKKKLEKLKDGESMRVPIIPKKDWKKII